MSKTITIAILGASGYTGAELIRLLLGHPQANIVALTGDSQAGKPIGEVYPHLRGKGLPKIGGSAGDLLVTIKITLPETSGPELEALMRKWQSERHYNPRQDLT